MNNPELLSALPVDVIDLRRANMEDAAALALVGAATFLDAFAGFLPGDALLAHVQRHHATEAYLHYLERPEVAAWLATAPGGAPVGYSMVTPPELPGNLLAERDLELKRIYLLSRFHGTGAAARLMDAALTEAKERGAGRLLLGVHAGNQRALRFYAKHGFTRIGGRTFTVGSMVCDDDVLARAL